jgi:hypothetical protein
VGLCCSAAVVEAVGGGVPQAVAVDWELGRRLPTAEGSAGR